jgi:hypothetical protein
MIKQLYEVYYMDNVIDDETKEFIQRWHYSKSARSQKQKHVFKLVEKETNRLVGVAIYGQPMALKQGDDIIELRRLCLIDATPKNTESYFIGKTLRWLDKNTSYSRVVSFADPNHGHSGTIYRASNFEYEGLEENGNPRVVQYGEKQYHMRQYYAKGDDGKYKADALRLQEAVRTGRAEIIKQDRKHKYTYYFRSN